MLRARRLVVCWKAGTSLAAPLLGRWGRTLHPLRRARHTAETIDPPVDGQFCWRIARSFGLSNSTSAARQRWQGGRGVHPGWGAWASVNRPAGVPGTPWRPPCCRRRPRLQGTASCPGAP
uniref:Putative secreted protein n=1 Tax=Ixodes ricinus TaxID=34613 RepID=A0A6B0UN14_IXORI